MKNKKKSKAVDKNRRNHPTQGEPSKVIDSSKGASGDDTKTLPKEEQKSKKGKAAQNDINAQMQDKDKMAHNDLTRGKATDRAFNKLSTNREPDIAHVKPVSNQGSIRPDKQKQACTKKSDDPLVRRLEKLADDVGKDAQFQEIQPIHVTAAMNDINIVREFFERDPATGKSRCDPNMRCLVDGSTALLVAIRSKKTEAAKILLANGADVKLTDNTGDNALMAAIKSGDANVVNAIWPYRGELNVDHVNYAGLSALHLATERKWECCTNFLLQNHANPNLQASDGTTPLMLAAVNGDTKTSDNLIKAGADILMEDYDGSTCICKAFAKKQKSMVHHLLKKLSNERKDMFIRSRLELIVSLGFKDEDKRLLETRYLPILHLCTEDHVFRNVFYNLKVVDKVTKILADYVSCFEIALLATHVLLCVMMRFTKEMDLKFVRQFIQCHGPDIVIYNIKVYTEQWKLLERETVAIFLPMIGLAELDEGKVWLKKNWVAVSEYLNFFNKNSLKLYLSGYSDNHFCSECKIVDEIVAVWQRFHDIMNEIQTEEREKHMTELLEEEEKEKEKQAKKKEKKKQKKLDKQTSYEDNTIEGTAHAYNDEYSNGVDEDATLIKNVNSNAGTEDSKQKRPKKLADVAKEIFKLPEVEPKQYGIPADLDPSQIIRDFPEYLPADMNPKSEQWTTIQTKKQIQKEKEKKQTKTCNDIQPVKNKKTPRKSPNKKHFKDEPVVSCQQVTSTAVPGSARWADVAKGAVKTNKTSTPAVPKVKTKILQRPENAKFGETDFPSLNGQPVEFTFPEKKNYIKPAKLTFVFNDPIVEPNLEQQNVSIATDNSTVEPHNIDFTFFDEPEIHDLTDQDNKHEMLQQRTSCTAEIEYEDVWDPNETTTEKMVESWVETEMDTGWDDNSGNTDEDQHQRFHAGYDEIEPRVHQGSTDWPDDCRYTTEDWSDEIEQIDNACAIVQNQAKQSDLPSTGTVSTPVQNNDRGDNVHANVPCYQQYAYDQIKQNSYTSVPQVDYATQYQVVTPTVAPERKGYVCPENCQVDIDTIIQHQTTTFPFFEETVRCRDNHPFFDPSVPLPKELRFGEDACAGGVDALFEVSHEIPSWFPDSENPEKEDTWNGMRHTTRACVKEILQPCPKEDFSTIDPAIIGYKNMNSQQYAHANAMLAQCNIQQCDAVKRDYKAIEDHYLSQNSYSKSQGDYAHQFSIDDNKYKQLYSQEYDNADKQTAVIKPLLSKSKQVPVVNSAFGQSLLENACRLERNHIDDEIGYPDEIDGEPFPNTDADATAQDAVEEDRGASGDVPLYFPYFHEDTKLSGHLNKEDVSVPHMLQRVQLESLNQYYQQHRQMIAAGPAASPHHDNFVYYASCAGMDRQDMEDCLAGKVETMNMKGPMLDENTKPPKTFKDISKPPSKEQTKPQPDNRKDAGPGVANHRDKPEVPHHIAAQAFMRQMPQLALPGMFPVGQYLAPPMHPANMQAIQAAQAAMASSVMNQIKEVYRNMMKAKMKSVRWKEELCRLRNLPTDRQMVVGKIVIPQADRDRVYIARPSSGPVVLGFLTDGSEVAVKVMSWRERDFGLDELQHLVNLDVSKYFMNKYKAFCSQDGFYYIASSLYEYSLPEYLSRVVADERVNTSIACSKLVWQLMRGLASLHQHCLMVHGDLRPENIVIDTDCNVRITGYGLGKNTARDTPYVDYTEDEKCWLAPEVLVHKQKVSFKSDIAVVGMLIYYILSGGKNPFGSEPSEIIENITDKSYHLEDISEEATHLLQLMLSVNKSERPCISDALRHPYFWSDEKRLRFILIAGSDVLRDLKAGVPMDGSVRDSMIGIIGTAPCHIRLINWLCDLEPVIIREMRVFRQYKNNVVELVLFVYNCCAHFDKMSDAAREVIDEPCKYFLSKFPTLFMTVYRAIKSSGRTERTCYKPFF